jgi:hypothetical protein
MKERAAGQARLTAARDQSIALLDEAIELSCLLIGSARSPMSARNANKCALCMEGAQVAHSQSQFAAISARESSMCSAFSDWG